MRNILVVIDMQKDFIDGSLGTAEAQAIVENVVQKISQYPKENILATRDTHTENYLQTLEGQNLPVVHCVKDTAGWQLDSRIEKALAGVKVFDKPGFGSLELADWIAKERETEEITVEMVGLCTDICVVSNALLLKAKIPEMRVRVDASCCAGVTPQTHEAALTTMKMCQIEVE